MKFTSSALTIVTLSSSSLLFTQGTKVPIGQYELLAAGEPYGEVFTLEPFNAKVYYEAKIGASIATDVYSGVTGESPCDAGSKISSFNTSAISSGPAYDTTTSDGMINSVEITIADVKTSGAYSTTGGNNGKVNICVRSYLAADYDSSSAGDEIVSFVDTHIDLNVDFTAKFQNFTQEVNITATASKTVEQNITKNVEVESFLCASGSNASPSYKIGQDFSVCVRPTEKYAKEGYAIDGFKSVTCKNTGTSRALIKNSLADPLTTVSNATVASEHLSVDGEKAGGSAGAFGSVVTAGYFANSENSFACEGEAKLKRKTDYSFTFPKYNFLVQPRTFGVNWHGFTHGLCVMGASSASVSVSEPNTHNFGYNAFPGFKDEQVAFVAGEPNYYTDITGKGPSVCEGGIFFQPTLHDPKIPQGSQPTLTATRNNYDTLTFCAALEMDPNALWLHRDGGWPTILEDAGFTKTGVFSIKDVTNGQRRDNAHSMYCKEIDTSPRRKLSTDFSLNFRDLQEATVAGDSPFATTIGLSSEGAEELMTASAATYNGLVGITTFGVSLVYMLFEVI